MADVREGLLRELLGPAGRLVVLSNRGPVTFERDRHAPEGLIAARGSGGLVTALGELGRHAPITWVSAALTDADREVAPLVARTDPTAGDGHLTGVPGRVRELFETTLPGQDTQLRLVDLPPEVFAPYYSTIANPFLWFVAHRMYQAAYGPNIDAGFLAAWRGGSRPAN